MSDSEHSYTERDGPQSPYEPLLGGISTILLTLTRYHFQLQGSQDTRAELLQQNRRVWRERRKQLLTRQSSSSTHDPLHPYDTMQLEFEGFDTDLELKDFEIELESFENPPTSTLSVEKELSQLQKMEEKSLKREMDKGEKLLEASMLLVDGLARIARQLGDNHNNDLQEGRREDMKREIGQLETLVQLWVDSDESMDDIDEGEVCDVEY